MYSFLERFKFLHGIIGMFIGGGLFFVLRHLWLDHLAFHELDAYIRMVAGKINKLP